MDQNHLLHALTLAADRRGFCAPNPAVGAVIVKDNVVIAAAAHQQAGSPHAEVVAIAQTEQELQGATIYVTLEPCCHWGKTPPCTQAIIEAGIKRVVYGFADPNPVVAGKGAKQLREAGISCEQLETTEVTTFYRSYQYWQQTKLPWVTAKLAMSLDGKIAAADNKPVKITGEALQTMTHQYRLHCDAMLTTARTINNDNPQLNVRDDVDVIAQKPIYIIDRLLSLDVNSQIFNTAQSVTIIHSTDADKTRLVKLETLGARCVAVAEQDGLLDLQQVLVFIGEQGAHDLWVEAGGRLYESLLQQQLINYGLIYVAPTLLGTEALSAFSKPYSLSAMAEQCEWTQHGDDMMFQFEFKIRE